MQGRMDLMDERRRQALRETAVKATEEKVDRHCWISLCAAHVQVSTAAVWQA